MICPESALLLLYDSAEPFLIRRTRYIFAGGITALFTFGIGA
jgi:hypothetical protein